MISVVIPLYNKEEQIADTLQSIFAQTFKILKLLLSMMARQTTV